MLTSSVLAAARDVFSPPLRRILWKSLALTVLLLALVWAGLTSLIGLVLQDHPLSTDYPIIDGIASFLAGAGIFIGLAYLLPPVSAIVAGYFLDDVAEVVESRSYPADRPGQALPLGKALLYGLRFAGLSLLVNLIALLLFFIPGPNIIVFFAVNAYLLGREYFELAAGRFWPPEDVARIRVSHRMTVLAGGAVLAALVLVPVVNLLIPIFGAAMMVHLHKRLMVRRLAAGHGAERLDAGSRPF
ncbi:sulfate transporter family protein [Microvirga rosea]|uniref:sulfate transporter family protein n=1 Tax=Microvirga rosea TaxID=2715425 RepID=UPI001D0AD0FC|nr:sulfate transporter family protein [Microvirga rosea]MCB8819279.1 sulfate transporter family protein [Microvirga rosea]